jgi:hypothetical protein
MIYIYNVFVILYDRSKLSAEPQQKEKAKILSPIDEKLDEQFSDSSSS